MYNYQKVHTVLEDIYKQISFLTEKEYDNYSLHFGKAGLLLFYGHWCKYFSDKNTEHKFSDLFSDVFDSLFEEEQIPNFSHGIYGKIWALKYTNELFDLEFFGIDELESINQIIFDSVVEQLKVGHNDFMHEGLGGILALDKKFLNNNSSYLFDLLLSTSIYKDTSKYLWVDYYNGDEEKYNLGLAHGQPSFWYFLSYLSKFCNREQEARSIITQAYSKVKEFKVNNYFPSYGTICNNLITIEETYARVGSWCYGDLSIANTLVLIGKSLEIPDLYEEGILLAKNIIQLNNFEKTGLYDLCLCHGASSCISIYLSLFEQTKDSVFATSAQHWVNYSVDFYNKDGIRFYNSSQSMPAKYYASLLNGYIGYGLSLIASLDKTLKWGQCLLLK